MKKKYDVNNFYNGIKDANRRQRMMIDLKKYCANEPERIAEIVELPGKWEYWAHVLSFMSEDDRKDVLNLSHRRKTEVALNAVISIEELDYLMSQLEMVHDKMNEDV
jgi:uncharacterized OB-fold protein